MRRNRPLIIAVLAALLTLSIGYALFSQTINVTGTATGQGSFDMQITQASIVSQVGSSGATVSLSNSNHTLNISVPKLEYPGAYVDIQYTIQNKGTINALLTKSSTTGADYYMALNSTNAIRVQPVIKQSGTTLIGQVNFSNGYTKYYYEPNDSDTEIFRVYWNPNIDTGAVNESANITYTIYFEQVTDRNDACAKMSTIAENVKNATFTSSSYNSEYDYNFNGLLQGNDATFAKGICNK